MDDEEPTFTTCGHTNILLPSREAAKASSQDKYVYGFHHIGPSSASARSPTRRAGEPPSEFDLMFKYMLDFSFPIVQTPPVQATTPLSEKEMELCWQLYERGGRIARGYFPDDSEQYCPEEGEDPIPLFTAFMLSPSSPLLRAVVYRKGITGDNLYFGTEFHYEFQIFPNLDVDEAASRLYDISFPY